MHRSQFLAAVSAAALTSNPLVADAALPEPVAGVAIPDTPLAFAATQIARSAVTPEILAHSLRTYYFAELIARSKRVAHDREAVYVAAILHDTGLSERYMSSDRRFEVDSAMVAKSLLQQHDIPQARQDLVWDAVALHDQSSIARYKQPEVMLVSAGVGADFGSVEALRHDDVVAVLRAEPRAHFVHSFLETVAAYVKKKPFATGASWITDVGYRMVPGFHLDNFVDEVTGSDPFAAYS